MTTAITITTTARRIARVVNAWQSGGFFVFSADGADHHWYSDRSYPTLQPGQIKFTVPHSRITAAEVQATLDRARAAGETRR